MLLFLTGKPDVKVYQTFPLDAWQPDVKVYLSFSLDAWQKNGSGHSFKHSAAIVFVNIFLGKSCYKKRMIYSSTA
jgi:hypothetical protein